MIPKQPPATPRSKRPRRGSAPACLPALKSMGKEYPEVGSRPWLWVILREPYRPNSGFASGVPGRSLAAEWKGVLFARGGAAERLPAQPAGRSVGRSVGPGLAKEKNSKRSSIPFPPPLLKAQPRRFIGPPG